MNVDAINTTVPQKSIGHVPGPIGIPILGNLHQFRLSKMHRLLGDWAQSYGPIYKFRLASKTVVVVSDIALIREILRDRPNGFRRMRSIESTFEEVGGNGIFSAEGQRWQRQRNITMPAFNSAHLKRFFSVLIKATTKLQERWESQALAKVDVDVRADLMRYAVDVTTALAFGTDTNILENKADPLHDDLEKIFPTIGRRVNSPLRYWRYIRLPRDRAFDRSMENVRQRIEQFVSDCRRRLEQNPELRTHPTNYLEGLLVARDEEGRSLTDAEVFANVLTILVAGQDTTANTIAWIVHHLVENPDVQFELQHEAEQVLGNEAILTRFEKIEELKFVEAVALESMRLMPVAPFLYLETNKDIRLSDYHIPKGTSVITLTAFGAKKEENFSEPMRFWPHRWIDSNRSSKTKHNTHAFLPFGEGTRFCPGRNLAVLETKSVLAMMAKNFRLRRPRNGIHPTDVFNFACVPKDLWVNVELKK